MMASDMEWFPLYVNDILTSRKMLAMLPEERGWYVLLLVHEWKGGPLPRDMDEMGALLGLDGNRMATAWQRIGRAFAEVEGGYVNARLEEVRQQQFDKLAAKKRAGKAGAEGRWGQRENGNRMADPMRIDAREDVEEKREEKKTTPPKAPRKPAAVAALSDVTDEWEECRAAYPKRAGGQGWTDAERSYRGHRAKGISHEDIQAGVQRYAAYIRAAGKEGTDLVKQASTFFGRGRHWQEEYSDPVEVAEPEALTPDEQKRRRDAAAITEWEAQHPDLVHEWKRDAMNAAEAKHFSGNDAVNFARFVYRRRVLDALNGEAA